MTATGVLGRERELERVRDWVRDLGVQPCELRIVGAAGMGKSTVWRAMVEEARAWGVLVCEAQAWASEGQLAFAGLGDLAAPLVRWLPELPVSQRRPLMAALLLDDVVGPDPDVRAVAVGMVSLVRRAAEDRTVVLAVDDRQWLDPSSAQVLDFVVRRLPPGAGVLSTVRTDAVAIAPVDLELGALSLSALHHVIRSRLGTAPARPVLIEIERRSGGNPLVALELADAAGRGGRLAATATIIDLVAPRLHALPAGCREALLLLAAGGPGTSIDHADLSPAVAANLVAWTVTGAWFLHPLYSEAVLAAASPAQRREAHRVLARDAVTDERRGRHLALATVGHDEQVAEVLDRGVEEVRKRGATAAALELAELAVVSSPPGEPRARRSLVEARLAFQAGDSARAIRTAEHVATTVAGRLQVEALLLLGSIHHEVDGGPAAVTAAETALAAAGDDALLRAEALLTLSVVDEAGARTQAHAVAAHHALTGIADPPAALLARTLVRLASSRPWGDLAGDIAVFDEAIAAEGRGPRPRVAYRASAELAYRLKYGGELDRALEVFASLRAEADAEGDDASLTYVLSHLPQIGLWSGRWAEAERWAREHLELAEQMSQTAQRIQALGNLALVLAHHGDLDEAHSLASEARLQAEQRSDVHLASFCALVDGVVTRARGDTEAAARALEDGVAARRRMGSDEPGAMWGHPELAECLVLLGRLDAAETCVAEHLAVVTAAGHRAGTAIAWRSNALVAAAHGRTDDAIELAGRSAATLAECGWPFDEARSLVTLGQIERRALHRGAARQHLESARAAFEQLGAARWASAATAEIARIGAGRRAPTELTETEQQVASLAAKGMTNRQVAAALFISPKTVEANLARAYRKLGTSSRAELGAKLRDS